MAEKRKYLKGTGRKLPIGRTRHFEEMLNAYSVYVAYKVTRENWADFQKSAKRAKYLYKTYGENYGELDPIEARELAKLLARLKRNQKPARSGAGQSALA